MKSIYARKQMELFLDEERSIEDEKSFEESSIEVEEEETKSDETTHLHKEN